MRTHSAISSTLLVLILALAGACVADNADSPVAVLYNQQPGADCTISSADTGAAIIRGTMDIQSPVGYLLTPVVKNFAQTSEYIDVDQRMAYLEGGVIRVAAGGQTLADYTTAFGAVVEPDGGTAGLLFELIPPALLQGLAGQLPNPQARVTLETTTQLFGILGGSTLDTKEFPYSIDVCNGCMVNNVGPCATFTGEVNNEGGKCNPLQDAPLVDCCTQDGELVCPAIVNDVLSVR